MNEEKAYTMAAMLVILLSMMSVWSLGMNYKMNREIGEAKAEIEILKFKVEALERFRRTRP